MEVHVFNKVTKKIAPIGLMAVVLIAGVAAPVHAAAVKQGAACAKSGLKAKSGKNSYVCQVNPATTSKKLVWVTTDCVTAAKSYLSAKKDSTDSNTQLTLALTKYDASVKSWTSAVNIYKTKITALSTNVYNVYDGKTKTWVKISGITAAIAAAQATVDFDTANRDKYAQQQTASAALLSPKYTAAQISEFATNYKANQKNADHLVSNYANWTSAVTSANTALQRNQTRLANFQKVQPSLEKNLQSAQDQVDKMTQVYKDTLAQQPDTAKQYNSAATLALSYQTTSCKAGI